MPCAAVPGGLVLPRLELRPVSLHALAARAQLCLKLICLPVYVRLRPPRCLFRYQAKATTHTCKAAEHKVLAGSAALKGKQGQVLVGLLVRLRMKAQAYQCCAKGQLRAGTRQLFKLLQFLPRLQNTTSSDFCTIPSPQTGYALMTLNSDCLDTFGRYH